MRLTVAQALVRFLANQYTERDGEEERGRSMQQTCPACGREALPGARFCRNWGAPLFAENEATTATTSSVVPARGGSGGRSP